MKIELGGGLYPRGDGFINVDLTENADIKHNLEQTPWPIADDSVDEIYSCHFLEHVDDPEELLREEITRICKLGARVEIRVPAPGCDTMMIWGHKHCFSPVQAINMETHFPLIHWKKPKRMKLMSWEYHPTFLLEEFKQEMPSVFSNLPDHLIMKYFPRTCHETRFFYQCVENEHFQG